MSLSLIIVSTFEFEKKCHIVFCHHFLSFIATNLKFFDSCNKVISLVLISDSVSLNCSSGLNT